MNPPATAISEHVRLIKEEPPQRFEVDAILFDIDGTLVDSTAAVTRTWTTWANNHGIEPARILEVCHGRRSQDTVAMFLPAAEDHAESVAELEQLDLNDLDGVVALPGTRDLLAKLPQQRWGAVTSGAKLLMEKRLQAAGLPVPPVLIASETVSKGKPDPEGYRLAATRLGFDVTRCLVIEDAPAGIQAGLAAGAQVMAVATSHPADELGAAHAVVPDLTACTITVTGGPILVDLS